MVYNLELKWSKYSLNTWYEHSIPLYWKNCSLEVVFVTLKLLRIAQRVATVCFGLDGGC